MNKVILVGRLTKDPETRYTNDAVCITSYTLAVDRKKKGEADFIRCKAFGKAGEFADKWFTKGMRVSISGRIETGSYINQKGDKVYTTDIIVEEQEFAQSKSEPSEVRANNEAFTYANQAELPFN